MAVKEYIQIDPRLAGVDPKHPVALLCEEINRALRQTWDRLGTLEAAADEEEVEASTTFITRTEANQLYGAEAISRDIAINGNHPIDVATIIRNEVINTQHIVDQAITDLQIADLSVTEAKIAVAAVSAGKIAAAAVEEAKIATSAVTEGKIAAAAVVADKIAANAVTSDKIIANAIVAGKIATDAVTADKIQANAVVAGKIATDAIVAANITAGAVTAVKINVSTLSAINANLGTITAGSIDAVTITGGTITGTTIKTAASNDRVEIDSSNGVRVYDSSDTLLVQMKASVYAGILVNGIRAMDSTPIFLETQDQSCQLFLAQGSDDYIQMVTASTERARVDANDGSGGGNQPTSLLVRCLGALKRVNVQQGTGPGDGYLYIS